MSHSLPSFESVFGFRTKLCGVIEVIQTDFISIDNEKNNERFEIEENLTHSISHGRW